MLLTTAHALAALAVFAVVINLVPMLVEQGMSRNLAALALGLSGVGQVVGRLGYARFAAGTTVTGRGVVVLAAVAGTTAALALVPSSPGVLIAVGMVLGLARGVYTLVQATAITDRWGPTSYGTLNGIMTAPALVAAATAPFAGAVLATALGSYARAFLALAGLAALAAVLMAYAAPARPPDDRSGPAGASGGRRAPTGAARGPGTSSTSSARTRPSRSAMIARTVASSWPPGSATGQSTYRTPGT